MKKKTIYVAFDGKEFSSIVDCNLYEKRAEVGRTINYLLDKKVRFFSGYIEFIDISELLEKMDDVNYIYFCDLSFDEKKWIALELDKLYDFSINIDDNNLYIKDNNTMWFYSLEGLEYRLQNRIKSYKADKKQIEKMVAKESF